MHEDYDRLIKDLTDLENKEEKIQIPDNIDEYLQGGMSKGRAQKKKEKKRLFSSLAACLIFAALIISIRVSPVVADTLSKIPGLSYLVELISMDQGLKDAVENEFITPINQSKEQGGVKITLKDMIIDSSGGSIFYSIENTGDHKFLDVMRIDVLDKNGEGIKAAYTYGMGSQDFSVHRIMEESLQMNFTEETVIPEEFKIVIKIRERDTEYGEWERNDKDVLPYTWEFIVPIDKESFKDMEKIYPVEDTISVQGQKITFEEIRVMPTRIAVQVAFDPENTMDILGFEDLEVVDEKGNVRGSIMNGVTASHISDTQWILYLQSNYFKDSKELYIRGSRLRAIEKNKRYIEIDLENKKMLKAPDDRVKLNSIEQDKDTLTINISYGKDPILDKERVFEVLGDIIDGEEKAYNSKGSSMRTIDDDTSESQITYTIDENIKSPIKIKIQDYPQRIKEEFKVKVK